MGGTGNNLAEFFVTLREKLVVRWLHTYEKTLRARVGALCAGEKGQLRRLIGNRKDWRSCVTPISNGSIISPVVRVRIIYIVGWRRF